MSLTAIRQALQTQLATLSPPIDTAYENEPYAPVPGAPYQVAYLLPAKPSNLEIGPGYFEQGIFQVSLYYPQNAGPGAATARAELIRAAFPFRSSFALTSGGTVSVIATPEVAPARAEDDRFMVPVKIAFYARIGS